MINPSGLMSLIEKTNRSLSFRYDSGNLFSAVCHLQNQARTALFFFINGFFWLENAFHVLYLFDRTHIESPAGNIINNLRDTIRQLNKEYSMFKRTNDLFNRQKSLRWSIKNAAFFFSLFYEEFSFAVSKLRTDERISVIECAEVRPFDITAYPEEDQDFLSPLSALMSYANDNFKEHLSGFYLHGSLSTGDYIPHWSDVDTLMIVKKETIAAPEKLIQLRRSAIDSLKYFYQVDPIQLHGHMVISGFDADFYAEPYFPLSLFNYSRSFLENERPGFALRESHTERKTAFWNDAVFYFLQKAVDYANSGKTLKSIRERKLFLHRLMTFPLFYLQAKGTYCYKKHSFEKARGDFPETVWRVIDNATDMMNRWPYKYRANRNMAFVSDLDFRSYFFMTTRYYEYRHHLIDGIFREFDDNFGLWIRLSVELALEGWSKIEEEQTN
ncbi:MAG: hypothetical protein HY757_05525 [Nitrospirae bacterium]|nr:hypothetical protein [Nitrospirota bacterium]